MWVDKPQVGMVIVDLYSVHALLWKNIVLPWTVQ